MMTETHRALHQQHVDRLARMASKAVPDDGIDLKRRKAAPPPVPPEAAPVIVEKPVVQDVPIFDYDLIQEIRIGRAPPHKAIQAAVCRLHYNMPMAATLGPCRTRDIVDVRHVAMFVSRIVRPRDSWPAIGRAYNRDHTTIISAVKRMRQRINNEAVALMVNRALNMLRAAGWTVPDSLEQAMLPLPPTPVVEWKPIEKPQQTHCKNGHEFSEDNTLYKASGSRRWRRCKHCSLEYDRIRGEARRERQRERIEAA